MQVRLRPGRRVLWRDSTTVQVGVAGRAQVTFTAPTAREVQLLNALETHGVAHDRSNPVLARLYDADLLLPMSRVKLGALPHSFRTRLAGDAQILGISDKQGEGWLSLARRQRSTIEVHGLGRTGALLTRLLAHVGVGRIAILDGGTVGQEDLSPGGYSSRHVGERRELALRSLLERDAPEVRINLAAERAPDLVILVDHHVVNPVRYQRLMRQDIPHLSVLLTEDRASVGPYVLPGKSPCLQCLDLHRVDRDAAWPIVATQLLNLDLQEPAVEESVLSGLAAHLAAGQVTAALAGQMPSSAATTMEFSVGEYVPALREWTMHPECGCGAVS